MFEDLARNLETPHALGMTTILVVPEGQREVFRETWELEGRDAPYVDYLTDDLTGFLRADRAASDYAAGITCCINIASPMPAMPAPTSRSGERSNDRRARLRAIVAAASAIAL